MFDVAMLISGQAFVFLTYASCKANADTLSSPILFLFLFLGVPVLVMAICYSLIFYQVRKRSMLQLVFESIANLDQIIKDKFGGVRCGGFQHAKERAELLTDADVHFSQVRKNNLGKPQFFERVLFVGDIFNWKSRLRNLFSATWFAHFQLLFAI